MAYSISDNFYSGSQTHPFQGMIQGNGVVSPEWILIVIILILYIYQQDLAPLSITSIT